MEFAAKDIANIVNGIVEGDENVKVHTFSKIEEGSKGTLSFLANPKYTKYVYSTNASIIIVNKTFIPEKQISATLIRVDDSYAAFATLLQFYENMVYKSHKKSGIETPSFIDASAIIGNNAYIGAFAYISKNAKIGNNTQIYPQCYIGDNVTIGDNTIVYSGAKIYHNCVIGNNCIIHSGVVIGSDGFGFAGANGSFEKIPQIGNVVIEDEVEVGSNTTIDRATLSSTIIRKGAKLDNLIQIAHNVEIGENTGMAAQSGVSGSTKIGKNCLIGGQVGFAGHLIVADNVKIGAQSGIPSNIEKEGVTMMGTPVVPLLTFQKASILFKKLPEMSIELNQLKKEVEKLKNNAK